MASSGASAQIGAQPAMNADGNAHADADSGPLIAAALQMAHDKLLAEWFWTDRWMGSSAFLLPMLARGVYREMLTQAWRRGAKLPNDPASIKRAIGATDAEWAEAWPLVSRYWRVDGTNHLVNDTQLSVYTESLESAELNHERAKKGAQARWKQSPSNAQADAQASPKQVLKECPPSPSPSPSLISVSIPVSDVKSKIREQPCQGSASFKAGANGKPRNGTPQEIANRTISKALAEKIVADEKVRTRAPRFR